MRDDRTEGLRWLRQAENDLEYARIGLREGFYAQVCFQCQQICEKALKAMHYGQLGKRVVFGHSLVQLGSELPLEAVAVELEFLLAASGFALGLIQSREDLVAVVPPDLDVLGI